MNKFLFRENDFFPDLIKRKVSFCFEYAQYKSPQTKCRQSID